MMSRVRYITLFEYNPVFEKIQILFKGNLLEMSSSWNFPARASPSYEVSEPSRAELGHFNFRAETELNFFKH